MNQDHCPVSLETKYLTCVKVVVLGCTGNGVAYIGPCRPDKRGSIKVDSHCVPRVTHLSLASDFGNPSLCPSSATC